MSVDFIHSLQLQGVVVLLERDDALFEDAPSLFDFLDVDGAGRSTALAIAFRASRLCCGALAHSKDAKVFYAMGTRPDVAGDTNLYAQFGIDESDAVQRITDKINKHKAKAKTPPPCGMTPRQSAMFQHAMLLFRSKLEHGTFDDWGTNVDGPIPTTEEVDKFVADIYRGRS